MPETDDAPITLPTADPDAAAQARAQATEYDSPFAPKILRLDGDGGEIEIPPHPNLRMFDDDAQAEYEKLEFEMESYDRHPDIIVPEQKIYDDKGNLTMTLEPTSQRGALKVPHRKTVGDETTLLDPPYTVRVVKIALGEKDYARLRAGKVKGRRGSAAEVWRIWNQQAQDVTAKEKADSKSAAGTVDGAAVSPTDTP